MFLFFGVFKIISGHLYVKNHHTLNANLQSAVAVLVKLSYISGIDFYSE